jgi:hypothetical protein
MQPTPKDGSEDSLMTGNYLGFLQQSMILFKKRMIVLKRNYLPYTFAFLIPVVATALISILLKDKVYGGCSPASQIKESDFETLEHKPLLVVGPPNALATVDFTAYQSMLPEQFFDRSPAALEQYIKVVDTLDEYNEYIKANFSKVSPGGFFLGDEPIFSYYSNYGFLGLYSAIFMQNAVDMLLTNTTISTSFR